MNMLKKFFSSFTKKEPEKGRLIFTDISCLSKDIQKHLDDSISHIPREEMPAKISDCINISEERAEYLKNLFEIMTEDLSKRSRLTQGHCLVAIQKFDMPEEEKMFLAFQVGSLFGQYIAQIAKL